MINMSTNSVVRIEFTGLRLTFRHGLHSPPCFVYPSMQDLHAAPVVCREQRESIVDMLEELLEMLPGQMLAASPDALLHGIKYNL